MDKSKRHLAWWVVGLLAVAAIVAWWLLRPAGVPEGFAVSNGRIEATEVDIASKIAGRIDTILVKEGQFVREGEVLAKMDTRVLQEQRLEAIAQNQRGTKRRCCRAGFAGATTKRNSCRTVAG